MKDKITMNLWNSLLEKIKSLEKVLVEFPLGSGKHVSLARGYKVRGPYNTFPDFFFVWAFKIVVDFWKFTMLLLYILWDDWQIFMISGSNEQ